MRGHSHVKLSPVALPVDLLARDLHRIRRSEYDQMVAMGVFGEDRVELLEGVIVDMSPNEPPHASPVDLLNEILTPALVGRARIRIQNPILAANESEPEPDVAVVPIADYSKEHPSKAFLIVEVATRRCARIGSSRRRPKI